MKALTQLPLPCLPDMIKGEENAGQRQSMPLTLMHSSRLAWNAINNRIGRTRLSHRPCPISASSISSQLVKNGTYKTNDCEFTRLVLTEVSELWRMPTPADKCVSVDFSPEEFARSLQMLKPGKAPGPDYICSELIIHAGAALKSWCITD